MGERLRMLKSPFALLFLLVFFLFASAISVQAVSKYNTRASLAGRATYTVNFETNGADTGNINPQTVGEGLNITEVSVPKKLDFDFIGWNTASDGTGIMWNFNTDVMPANDLTLYAQWTPTLYEATFDVVAGDPMFIPSQKLPVGTPISEPAEIPTQKGATFVGWVLGPLDNDIIIFGTDMPMPSGGIKFYAKYNLNYYAIKYDPNGGVGENAPSQATYNSRITRNQSFKEPTRVGYTYDKFNYCRDPECTIVKVWNTERMPDHEVTTYARWLINNYKLSFDLNSGDGVAPATQTVNYQDLGQEPADPVKKGYTFIEWNTSADGTGNAWDFAVDRMPANDVKLYAQWEINPYQLNFDLNGAPGTNPASQTILYNELGSDPGNVSYTGYTFGGWNTSADGSGSTWDFATDRMPANDVTLYAQWIPNPYILSFDLNGAPGAAPDDQTILFDQLGTDPGNPSYVGHTFISWNTSADGSGSTWDFAADKMPANNVTLYAQWETNKYTLNFELNGAPGTNPDSQIVPFDELATDPGSVSYPGYTFGGWNTNANGSGTTWDFTTDKMPANDVTLYAQWIPNPYILSFDLNGAPGVAPGDQTILFDQLGTNPGNPSYVGHTFISWNTSPDGSGSTWDFAVNKMPANDVTLYAQWETNKYTLNFELNGAPGTNPDSQIVPFDELATDPGSVSYPGYTFGGWNTNANGSGTTWDFTTDKMPANDVTLYAQWIPNPYTLSFDLNGAPGVAPGDQTILFDQLGTNPGNPTYVGHTFISWNTSADGSGSTWDFAVNKMPANDVTLYAQWETNKYTLNFELNGAPGINPDSQTVPFDELATDPGSVSYPGHTFGGWNTSVDGSGTTWDFTTDKMPAKDVTLYAQWDINSYELSFVLNGAPGATPPTQTVNYQDLAVAPGTIVYPGHTFLGWNLNPDGSGSNWDFATDRMPARDVVLYAQWAPNKHNVIFDLNGVSAVKPDDQTVEFGNYVVKPTDPANDAYGFIEWNTSPDGSGVAWDFANDKMPDNDVTLYAIWSSTVYIVNYDINGGTGITPADESVIAGKYVTKPVNEFSRDGYQFGGWYTTPDTSGTPWDFANDKMPSKNITLYAKWLINPYNVHYDLNGAPGVAPADQMVDVGSYVTKPVDPAYKYHTFLGWNTSADGSGVTWNFGSDVMPANDVYLYAIWQEVKYNASFDINGGYTEVPADQTVRPGDLVIKPADPAKEDSIFIGWEVDGVIWDFDTMPMPERDIEFKAIYVPIQIKVEFDLNGGVGEVPETQYLKRGSLVRNPAINFSHQSKKFIGWSLSPNGDQIDLSNMSIFDFANTLVDRDIVLYAMYAPNDAVDPVEPPVVPEEQAPVVEEVPAVEVVADVPSVEVTVDKQEPKLAKTGNSVSEFFVLGVGFIVTGLAVLLRNLRIRK